LAGVARHPSAWLLLAQLAGVVAYPFLDQSRVGSAVLGVMSMIAVGLALWVVRSTPALTVIAVCLGAPAVVMTVLEAVLYTEQWVTLTSALLHAPFYFYVSYSLIRYLFHDDRVTTDEPSSTRSPRPSPWSPGASPTSTSPSRSSRRARSRRSTAGPSASSTCCSSPSPT
jgi:hypothetical protein